MTTYYQTEGNEIIKSTHFLGVAEKWGKYETTEEDIVYGYDGKLYLESECPEPPAPTEEEIKQARIAELQSQLASTDYKIIKCSECQLAGVELPYDIVELHTARQALRDEINELEK